MSFSTIPILDLSLAKDPSTKPQFLDDLRHALLEVGFFYLKNVGIPAELTQAVIREGIQFFDLPTEEKCVCSPFAWGSCPQRRAERRILIERKVKDRNEERS
jgi:isopenicillin N synthase-like dioxygenase